MNGPLDSKEKKEYGPEPKRYREYPPACILDCCYVADADNVELTSPIDLESWKTLVSAAQIRNYQPVLDIVFNKNDEQIPSIFYHRKCRSLFTMKKALDRLRKENEEQSAEIVSSSSHACKRASTRQLSSTGTSSRVYEAVCIFCDKNSKYRKRKKSRENLVKCVDLRADEKIRKVSIEKGDRKIIALVSRELVAAEAHYHRSCYKEYTRTDDCKNNKDELKTEPSEYETTETQAYEMLRQYIREDLISNPRVIKFTELITKLSFYMSNLGVLRITDSTRNNLKRRLETTFGTLLHFEKEIEGKRPLVVFPDNLTKLNLIRDNIRLQKQIELNKHCLESSDNVQQAVLFIRQSIKEQEKWLKTWPPTASELNESSVFLPESLRNLLVTLLTGNSKAEELSARVKRLVNSFGQDLVYGVTCGSQRTPKHIFLPYAIKSLTNQHG